MQKNIYTIITLIIFAITLSCGDKASKSSENGTSEVQTDDRIQITQTQFEQNKMEIAGMTESEFPVLVTTSGMIDVPPENRAVVSATMGGYIQTTPLLIGDNVRKGQLLVTIENPEFVSLQQRYMEVNGQLGYLKAEYERQQTMVAENITSQKSFLKAESDYKTGVAKYNGLKKQLGMLNISAEQVEKGNISSVATIYAPIAGSITSVNVSKGTYVSPATSIMEMINNDHIHIELSVFEKDILKVKKGQVVEFKIPESSENIFTAEVHLVGTSIGENRTIKVHAHIENEDEANFLTGMFVEANIITETSKQLSLPTDAIAVVENESFVLLLDEKIGDTYYFKQVPVNTLGSYKNRTSFSKSSSFKQDAQFLTKGAFSLLGE
ncbi:efflux RND transporter periplasmic adaptor subunit [Maribacter hydrothermalis]|uniref:Efflux transporter periplasmic adaptor subunit n=1 Tax=Maribacter hydrothermalis TaxID=1836467 RepID=A0A1B7Z058_9FLAO|nr:efflux RND transporter periplasmic adaptor subunit [Maribacter hydrothermalis]APQ16248.1 efflux transporter periplasmic adaptor subunit [Maribacter hydrothermalis]OBR36064.1 efflux transporter periplasmic adaptor subunit [Maribacter hydrothermalis]